MPTESSASHQGETFVQETEATIYDYKGALVFWSTNGSALSEAFPSLERGVENEDTRLSFYTKSTILVKISTQPHTIVKQIYFPIGNVLFLSWFFLSKN